RTGYDDCFSHEVSYVFVIRTASFPLAGLAPTSRRGCPWAVRNPTRPQLALCRTRQKSCPLPPGAAEEEPVSTVLPAVCGIRKRAGRPFAIPPCRHATSGRPYRREIRTRLNKLRRRQPPAGPFPFPKTGPPH